jgi:outer membrane protein
MRVVPVLSVFVAVLVLAGSCPAQDRLAYANLDTILTLLPETKTMAASIDSLGRSLAKELEVKEAYAQQKVEQARKAKDAGATDQEIDKFRAELEGLEKEIRQGAEDADARLAKRRSEVLKPLFEKVERTIEEVAKAGGFTMVLNSHDGDGNSIVLYGEDGRDITEKVLAKLGVSMPAKDVTKSGATADPKTK